MRIPNEKIGRVIGKEGATINRIRQVGSLRRQASRLETRTGLNPPC
jgi:predicted RNA-binding protein YlqC (UPF0109 family)